MAGGTFGSNFGACKRRHDGSFVSDTMSGRCSYWPDSKFIHFNYIYILINSSIVLNIFKKIIHHLNNYYIFLVVNVKEEPGSSTMTSSGIGGIGVSSGVVGSTMSTGVSSTGFPSVDFQAHSKCYM